MNKKYLILLPFLLLYLRGGAQNNAFSVPEHAPDHPRLLLLRGEESGITKKLASDATYNFLHKIIIKECDAIIAEPLVERTMIGRRLLRASREFQRRVFFLGYAWRVTHQEKYFVRAVREMKQVASFTDWNPSHFLDVAEMTMGVAIGYDWLYDKLPDSTRVLLEDAIVKKGLEPSLLAQNNSWLTASHNWNQACNASLTFGALAIMERKPQLAKSIIERSIRTIGLAMDEYLPDGGYPEGYGYWSYGTTFNVLLISALEKAFGKDFGLAAHPGFRKTPYYLLNMTGPSGLPFNYSDCDPKPMLNPAMFWFASLLKDPSVLAFESRLIAEHKNLHRVRQLPMLMIWAKGMDLEHIPAPQALQWIGKGKNPVALLRSSWEAGSALYVGLKAGSPLVTHSHLDIGSFVMDALGERWAIDLGSQDYNSLESKALKIWKYTQESDRWKVFRLSNFSHNTLTINKGLQSADGYAPIISSTSARSFQSAITDLSSMYKSSCRKLLRGVAIVDQEFVVIRDEIESSVNSTIRWNMLTGADVKIIDNKTAELRKNGKKLILRVAEPADAVLTTWSTAPPSPYDEANPGTVLVGFEAKNAAGKLTALTVLLIPETSSLQNKTAIPPLKDWPSLSALE